MVRFWMRTKVHLPFLNDLWWSHFLVRHPHEGASHCFSSLLQFLTDLDRLAESCRALLLLCNLVLSFLRPASTAKHSNAHITVIIGVKNECSLLGTRWRYSYVLLSECAPARISPLKIKGMVIWKLVLPRADIDQSEKWLGKRAYVYKYGKLTLDDADHRCFVSLLDHWVPSFKS